MQSNYYASVYILFGIKNVFQESRHWVCYTLLFLSPSQVNVSSFLPSPEGRSGLGQSSPARWFCRHSDLPPPPPEAETCAVTGLLEVKKAPSPHSNTHAEI